MNGETGTEIGDAEEQRKEILIFLESYEFMKLGQAVNRGQWDSAMMTLRRMDQKVKKLEIKEFEQPMKGLRLAVSGRNELQAKQILAMLVAKRVRMREALQSTK
ncbi:MAG: hypothetical protein IJZ34_07410 [Lachnospiraceae bacterium]|nr:hypothetical protein [Lachnospiraceae bacterium]